MKFRDGYLVSIKEKYKRGCAYCMDGKSLQEHEIRPNKKTCKTREEYKAKRKEYRDALNFCREDGRRSRDGINLQGFILCPYKHCPYSELDECKCYRDFVAHAEFGDITRLMGGRDDEILP